MTTETASGVGNSTVTSTAPVPGELVRRCNTCGTPLTDEGLVALAELNAASADFDQARALRDERADLERHLARAKDEFKTAKRLGDEQARVRAMRAIEAKQANLAEVDRILAGIKLSEAPADGSCPTCGTVFRGGRVDRRTVWLAVREHGERSAQLAALERELVSARGTLAAAKKLAALGTGNPRVDPESSRKRVDNITKRIPQIEAAIARAKKELSGTDG
jgi:DNA repair exonuclease SbcCD ATPase subunit